MNSHARAQMTTRGVAVSTQACAVIQDAQVAMRKANGAGTIAQTQDAQMQDAQTQAAQTQDAQAHIADTRRAETRHFTEIWMEIEISTEIPTKILIEI